jgi:hypothetical protein
MLGSRQRLAQDFIENPLPHPKRQSREAGSCTAEHLHSNDSEAVWNSNNGRYPGFGALSPNDRFPRAP